MDLVLENFCGEIMSNVNQKQEVIDKLHELSNSKDLEIKDLESTILKITDENDSLKKKLEELNSIKLVKTSKKKSSTKKSSKKKKTTNSPKVELETNTIEEQEVVTAATPEKVELETNTTEEQEVVTAAPPEKVELKENILSSSDEETDEESEEEVDVELIKIKKRYYYCEQTEDENIIYKAIKIKKGGYDVGDRIGLMVDGKLIKD